MKLMIRIAVVACLALLVAGQAMAAAPRTFVVLPFQVNGPQGYGYLEKAISSTLSSRLYWEGQTRPLSAKTAKAPISEAAAQKAQAAVGADYAVWGTVTVMGNDCTLDVLMRDKAGKEWRKTSQTPVNGLMGSLSSLADSLSAEAFGRPVSAATGDGRPMVNQMNPDIVVNETGQQQVYLNPQFRYQGAGANDGSRMRSQALPFVMVDMAVGDFDGDGKNEVAILSDHKLYIYRWQPNGQLKQLAETVVSMTNQSFSLRAISLTRSRARQLVAVTFEEENNRPYSYIYTFEGGKLREFCRRSEYFLSVAQLPPTFTPTLIGQAWDSLKLFQPGVYVMHKNGDRYAFGTRLELPSGATVFNFAWMPGDKKTGGDKLIVLNDQERLKVYNQPKGEAIHTTMDHFSGSSTGMNHYKTMAGLGIDRNYQLPDKYFSPMRLITVSLERNGEYVLLVNKPISTASQFFDRYRFFPQGEIHALYWDGVGLGLKWKTRRIRGSVASVDLADLNNDGVMDLVVGLNTHPGPVGVGSRRCIVTAYPLDLSRANPNTAPDMHDFEN